MDDKEALEELDHSAKHDKRVKSKRVASRFFNAVLALVFFILFAMSLVSFSAFSHKYRDIAANSVYKPNSQQTCILNAKYITDAPNIQLGEDGSCRLAIGGEVLIAVYSLTSIAVMIIKIIGGWSIISCFLLFELIAAVLMTLLSFSTSVVISVGLSLTCNSLTSGGLQTCGVSTLTFFNDIQIAEATAWLGFAILVGIDVFYIICIVMYCYGKRQAKIAKKQAYEKAIRERKKEDEQSEHDEK